VENKLIKTKAEINQEIKIDDETIEKLQQVKGNVYIVQSNNGSINSSISAASLSDILLEHYERGVGFKELVNQVKKIYISFALQKSINVAEAAKRLKVDRRLLDYYLNGEDKQVLLENKSFKPEGGK
jgi:hypothetical protein